MMRFCNHCANMLYPKEDPTEKRLLYACRHCEHQEVADDPCVYRNEIKHTSDERAQIVLDVVSDPTLQRTRSVRCESCGNKEAVFFQANTTAQSDAGMTLFFVCCNPTCGHRWED